MAVLGGFQDFDPEIDPLPPAESPYPILRLEISGRIPQDAPCASCRIRFVDGLSSGGLPVTNVASAGGESYLPVLGDRTVRLRPAFCAVDEPLALGDAGPVAFERSTLSACRREACFQFTAPKDRTALLRLVGGKTGDRNQLLLKLDGIPSPGDRDLSSGSPVAAPVLLVPRTKDGLYHVHALNLVLSGESVEVGLVGELGDVLVERLSASRGACGQDATVAIFGKGFREGETNFRLLAAEKGTAPAIPVREVKFISPERVDAVFDLSDLDFGTEKPLYDLVARQESGDVVSEYRLENAFQAMPFSFSQGLSVGIVGHARYAFDRPSRLAISITNVTDRDVPAPLLRLRGAAGNRFRLDGEEDSDSSPPEILILGTAAEGPAGILPPGSTREIPINFQSRERLGVGAYTLRLTLELFSPPEDEAIPWSTLEAPPGADSSWGSLCLALPGRLGGLWGEYRLRLGEIATRMARRSGDGSSALEAFRHACELATLGWKTGAVTGRVTDGPGGPPLAEVRVIAVDGGGAAAACANTDGEGRFVLERLDEAIPYRIRVDGRVTDPPEGVEVTVPEGDDVLGLEIAVSRDEYDPLPLPVCDELDLSCLPIAPLVPPDSTFVPVAAFRTQIVSSLDPNGKDENVTDPLDFFNGEILYRINFENTGKAPAQRVEIVDRIPPGLDLSTARLVGMNFGLPPKPYDFPEFAGGGPEGSLFDPSGLRFFRKLSADLDAMIDVRADMMARTVSWTFQSLDPDTGYPPNVVDGVVVGFLPPEDGTGRGQGEVSFSVEHGQGLDEGDEVVNEATLKFDQQDPCGRSVVNYFTNYPIPEVPELPNPEAGLDLRIRVNGDLGWSKSQYPSIRYRVKVWTGTQEPLFPEEDVFVNSWSPPNLEPETEYLWRVQARNLREPVPDVREGEVWTFKTYPLLPGAPTGLWTENPGTDRPTFHWRVGAHNDSCAVYLKPASDKEPWPDVPSVVVPCEPDQVKIAWTPTVSLQAGVGRWEWRVKGRNDLRPEGCASSLSMIASFHLVRFLRGDADGSKVIDVTDAIDILGALFMGSFKIVCEDAADVDDSRELDISDPILLLGFLFLGGSPPEAPYPRCGIDPTADDLGCASYPPCNP